MAVMVVTGGYSGRGGGGGGGGGGDGGGVPTTGTRQKAKTKELATSQIDRARVAVGRGEGSLVSVPSTENHPLDFRGKHTFWAYACRVRGQCT